MEEETKKIKVTFKGSSPGFDTNCPMPVFQPGETREVTLKEAKILENNPDFEIGKNIPKPNTENKNITKRKTEVNTNG